MPPVRQVAVFLAVAAVELLHGLDRFLGHRCGKGRARRALRGSPESNASTVPRSVTFASWPRHRGAAQGRGERAANAAKGPCAPRCALGGQELRRRAIAQLERALEIDEPFLCDPVCAKPTPGMLQPPGCACVSACTGESAALSVRGCGVLDPLCVAALRAHPSAEDFADFVDRPHDVAALMGHWLVQDMRRALFERGCPSVVLSLSGGVDSMVHLVLLWAVLQHHDCNFELAALHITYPAALQSRARSSVVACEEEWIARVCSRLGVKLYVYRLPLRRPLRGRPTGLSHSEYEEGAMQTRFRMYERVARRIGYAEAGWVAVVAHHQDDVDENRLVSLSRGKRLHVDGMRIHSNVHDVTVLRPLLHVRKADLQALADRFPVCYVQDVRPCLREVVRDAMQSPWLLAEEAHRKQRLHALLSQVGETSDAIDQALTAWLSAKLWHGSALRPPRLFPSSAAAWAHQADLQDSAIDVAPHGQGIWACGVDIGLLMDPKFIAHVSQCLFDMEHIVANVAKVWNPALDVYRDASSHCGPSLHPVCRDGARFPDRGALSAKMDFSWGPLKPIHRSLTCHDPAEVGFLILRGALDAMARDARVEPVMGGLGSKPPPPRAIRHLWEHMRARDAETVAPAHQQPADGSLGSLSPQVSASGFLSRSVHYRYDASQRFLALFRDGGGKLHGSGEQSCIISSRSRRGWKQKIASMLASSAVSRPALCTVGREVGAGP